MSARRRCNVSRKSRWRNASLIFDRDGRQKSGLADLSVERFLQWCLGARLYSPSIITTKPLIALWSGPKITDILLIQSIPFNRRYNSPITTSGLRHFAVSIPRRYSRASLNELKRFWADFSPTLNEPSRVLANPG